MSTQHISSTTGKWMIAVAAVIDLIQFGLVFIPIIGWVVGSIVSALTALLFGMWFSNHDVGLMKPERVLGFGGTILGELTPFIGGGAPFWTCLITYNVLREWMKP